MSYLSPAYLVTTHVFDENLKLTLNLNLRSRAFEFDMSCASKLHVGNYFFLAGVIIKNVTVQNGTYGFIKTHTTSYECVSNGFKNEVPHKNYSWFNLITTKEDDK